MKFSRSVTLTCVDLAVGDTDLATTSCGRLICDGSELEGCLSSPYISPTAGPTVIVSVAPSMPAGILSAVLPCAAADAAAFSALKVKVATASDIAPYVTVVETPSGSLETTGGLRPPASADASAALVVAWS